MTTALIIGPGAAATGAALVLSHRESAEITVIEISLQQLGSGRADSSSGRIRISHGAGNDFWADGYG
jgi:hypothetical protein